MSEAEHTDQHSPCGNASPTSTQRVAEWRARKKRGVLYVASLEVYARDLRVLKRFGHLASDDPEAVGKEQFENALWSLLDGLARQLGMFEGQATPPKGGAEAGFRQCTTFVAKPQQAHLLTRKSSNEMPHNRRLSAMGLKAAAPCDKLTRDRAPLSKPRSPRPDRPEAAWADRRRMWLRQVIRVPGPPAPPSTSR